MMFSISEIKKNSDGISFNSVLEIKEKLIERTKDVLDVKEILYKELFPTMMAYIC